MVKITEPTTQQINTALNSLKTDIDNAVKNMPSSKQKSETVIAKTNLEFESPLKENDGKVSIETTGKWNGVSERAIRDSGGNKIDETYIKNSEKGNASGVATLDSQGRIPYSQLPESAVEFKGTWNAYTNEPTITQGVGTNGDFYIVSTEGIWNNIQFLVNDRILFDGTSNSWIKLASGDIINDNSISNYTTYSSTKLNNIIPTKTSELTNDSGYITDISGKLNVNGSNGTAAGVSALINKLTTGDSDPVDNDYYVSQYVNGGTTTTTYHRRPISKLWNYIKTKLFSNGASKTSTVNANTLTKPLSGGYHSNTPYTYTDNSSFGNLINLNNNGVDGTHFWNSQLFIPADDSIGDNKKILWLRNKNATTWGNWAPINSIGKETQYKGASSVTGGIQIRLPGWDNVMFSMWVDVYDYTSSSGTQPNKYSFSVYICGYCYQDKKFYATSAYVFGGTAAPDANRNVYIGNISDNPVIQIGSNTSVWSYPQVKVRDVQVGYATDRNTINKWSSYNYPVSVGTISNYVTLHTASNADVYRASVAGSAGTATNASITKTTDTTNGDKLQIGSGTAVNVTNSKHAATADTATTATKIPIGQPSTLANGMIWIE